MGRTLTSTMEDAQSASTYKFLSKATIYPSRIFFDSVQDDFPHAFPEPIGLQNDPYSTESTEYSSLLDKLVTWYEYEEGIVYQIQGDDEFYFTDWETYFTLIRPAVFGGKLFFVNGDNELGRYSIDYSLVGAGSDDPFTEEVEPFYILNQVECLHAVSQTEAVAICSDNGGYRIIYINGTSQVVSTERFVFPMINDWDESDRTMKEMAKFSGAAKLGNRIFAYISAASTGEVHGMFYDLDTETWGNVFIAVPTDKAVSMCEFRIINAYERNNYIYICGWFYRTDGLEGAMPYTNILSSEDGKTFSLGKFSLVSNIGYRFAAHVGSNNRLYISNSNRVCSAPLTWYFDGDDDTTSENVVIDMSKLNSVRVSQLDSMNIELKSGDGVLASNPYIVEGSKILLEAGYETSVGEEYIDYSTFIIDRVNRDKSVPKSFSFSCTHISLWNMNSLSMPFYAEIAGISATFDTFSEVTGLLYTAPTEAKFKTDFWIDLNCWGCEPWEDADAGITRYDTAEMYTYWMEVTPPFKMAIVLKREIRDQLSVSTNPVVTSSSMALKLYGWYYSVDSSTSSPDIEIMIIHTDKDDEDEQVFYSTEGKHWHRSYDTTLAGDDPIELTVTGIAVGRKIKRVGIVVDTTPDAVSSSHHVYPWRVEFVSGVSCPVALTELDSTWNWLENDKALSITDSGKPYIMFSQKPYNSLNFTLAAEFENTVSAGVAGYPVGVGLVGFAEDAGNYILARWKKLDNIVELVKVRNGQETVISSLSVGFTVNNRMKMQFVHRDGIFIVSIYDDSVGYFKVVLSVEWNSTYGFMFTASKQTKKCGIYGIKGAPIAEIVGFSIEDSVGIPVCPLADLSDFSSSGLLKIGGSTFSYSTIQALPSYVRGPSQAWGANYLEAAMIYDFDLQGSSGSVAGYLAGFTNGLCVILSGINFTQLSDDVGGYQVSLYQSLNKDIVDVYLTTDDKVFVTGGFKGISQLTGEVNRFGYRQYAVYQIDGEIKCFWFMGVGGEADVTTVQDLCARTAALAGAKMVFPGNSTISSILVDGETELFEDDYAESFDLQFETSEQTYFEIITNIKLSPDAYDEYDDIVNDTGLKLVLSEGASGSYILSLVSTPSNTAMYRTNYSPQTSDSKKFRFMCHDNCFSLFQDNRWVATIVTEELIFNQEDNIQISILNSESAFTASNVVLKELSDPREAVYIDLETDAISAIRSIAQERPVEMIPQYDGTIAMYYDFPRTPIDLPVAPETHSELTVNPYNAASDAIVYSAKEVRTVQFPQFAAVLGFSTKLFRFPNLFLGAIEATYRTLKKLFQQRKMTTLSLRPILSITPGDYVDFSYTSFEDEVTVLSGSIISESVDLSFTNSGGIDSTMQIVGREND